MPDPNSADLMVRQHGIGAVERQEWQPSFNANVPTPIVITGRDPTIQTLFVYWITGSRPVMTNRRRL